MCAKCYRDVGSDAIIFIHGTFSAWDFPSRGRNIPPPLLFPSRSFLACIICICMAVKVSSVSNLLFSKLLYPRQGGRGGRKRQQRPHVREEAHLVVCLSVLCVCLSICMVYSTMFVKGGNYSNLLSTSPPPPCYIPLSHF